MRLDPVYMFEALVGSFADMRPFTRNADSCTMRSQRSSPAGSSRLQTFRRRTALAALATMISVPALVLSRADAASLTWGAGGTGGNGTWDTNTTPDWWNGTLNLDWTDTTGTDTANFGGPAGTVALSGNVFANALNFNVGGYTLSEGTLTLAGSTPTINTVTGTTTIGSVITGSAGLTKAGAGTLIFTGANNYTGGTTITGGTLQLGDGVTNAAFGTGTYSVGSGATLRYLRAADVTAPTWANVLGSGVLSLMTNRANSGTTNDWGQVALSTGFTGTLQIERGRVFTSGTSSLGNASAVIIQSGAQLGTWNGGTYNQNLTIAGTGYGEAGYESALRLANAGFTTTMNGTVTLSGAATIGSSGTGILNNAVSGAFDLTFGTSSQGGKVVLNGTNTYSGNTIIAYGTLEIGGTGTLGAGNYAGNISNAGAFLHTSSSNQTLSGIISGAGTLTKSGPATLTLSGANTYTGSTTLSGGTLVLDYSTNNNSKLSDSAALILNGGTLTLAGATGSHTELVGSTTLGGVATINRSGVNTAKIALGAITRSAGGALEITGTGLATTTSANVNGILPGLTLGGVLAANDGSNNIVAYSAFTNVNRLGGTIANGPTTNVGIIEAGSGSGVTLAAPGTTTINTLSNAGTAGLTTIDLGAGNTLCLGTLGTIASAAGTAGLTIIDGTLTAGGATNTAGEILVANQSATTTTIGAVIANNGSGAVSLTKSGAGTLALTGVDTYAGLTTVGGGTLIVNGSIAGNATINSGTLVAGVDTALSGTSAISLANAAGTTFDVTNRTIAIGSLAGGGTAGGNVLVGAGTLTTGGDNTSPTFAGIISGTGSLTKVGTGMESLTGANTYSGGTTLTAGTLSFASGSLGTAGSITMNGGTLQWNGTNTQDLSTRLTMVNGTAATFDTNGNNVTFANAVGNGTSAGLIKTGNGILTFTSANTYAGLTTINVGSIIASTPSGVAAIAGDITLNNTNTTNLWFTADNQLSGSGLLTFTNTAGGHGRFLLEGTAQSVAGIVNNGTASGVVENSESSVAGPNNTGSGTLTLTGSSTYSFAGYLRNWNGTLSLIKNGAGTQTLSGANINYTGATTVNSGTLMLLNTTSFASASTVTGGNLTIAGNGSSINVPAAATFSLAGGNLTFNNQTNNYIVMGGAVTANNAAGSTIFYQSAGGVSSSGVYLDGGLKGTNSAVTIDVTGAQAGSGVVLRTASTTLTGSILVTGNGTGTATEAGIAILLGAPVLSGADITLNSARLESQQIAGDISWASAGGSVTIGALSGNANAIAHGANTLTVGATSHGGAFAGVISGTQAFTKIGTGTQALSGTNTYTGATTINGGTLQLDFAAGGASNIISPSSALVLGGGTLEIKGGTAEANIQTFNGVSGVGGTLKLTQNGATSINATLGAITASNINFVGGDTTVTSGAATPGNLSFLTSTVAGANDGQTRLGTNLWNGSDWASTANGSGTTYVVKWQGTYTNLATDAAATNATGDLRIIDGAGAGTATTYNASTTINSLLVAAPTFGTTVDLTSGTTLTIGGGAGATGAVAIGTAGKSLTIGSVAGQGTLTAGASGASSLIFANDNSASTLTVNANIADNSGPGAVSVSTLGNLVLNGANTYSGGTTITSGVLQLAGNGTLGGGAYAGAISNGGTLQYSSSANQTLSGIISGAGGLIKDTANSTLTLSVANTYTGPTNINAGTVKLGNAAGLGSSPLVTVGPGGTLDVAGLSTSYPIVISGTGAGGVGALYNSSTTAGGGVGPLTLNADASIGNANGNTSAKTLGLGVVTLNGNTLTIASGEVYMGLSNISSGNININSGAGLYLLTSGSLTNVTGTITIQTGGILDTRDSNNTGATSAQTIALNGGTLGMGLSAGNNGGGIGANLINNITVDATNGGTINSNNTYDGHAMRLYGSLSGSGTLTLLGNAVEFDGNVSGYTGTISGGSAPVAFNSAAAQTFNGSIAGTRALTKSNTGALTLTGSNSYSGTTTVSSGTLVLTGSNTTSGATSVAAGSTLRLDYSTNNNRKIGSGALTLSGGTIQLAGGSFADSVASTNLSAGTTSNITLSNGASTLNLGAITVNSNAFLNFGQNGIALTSNANVDGILGPWATINNTDWAVNNGSGLIVAPNYSDVTRLAGTKTITSAAGSAVRITEGTGTAGNILLGSPVTTIGSLNQSSVGGVSAAVIDPAGQTLAVTNIMVSAAAGSLTIGTGTNNGTLRSDGTALVFRDFSGAGITVNSVIGDGTGATTVTKYDSDTLTFTGTNTYSGGTIVNAGTLTASLGTAAGAKSAFGTGPITANSGTTLRFFAGSTPNVMSHANAINLNGATLRSEDAFQTFTGNIALTGADTVDVVYNNKPATFAGVVSGAGTLTKTDAGTLILSGNNTYTGATTVSAGTLQAGNANAFGTTAAGTTVSSGAVVDLNGQAIGVEAFTINGTGISSGGALINTSTALPASLSGTVTLGADSSVGGAGNLALSGVISGGFAVTKIGAGTLTLSGANTYTGATTVSAGMLVAANATTFGTTAAGTTVSSGAAVDLNGQTIGAEAFTISGTGINSAGALMNSNTGTAASLSGAVAMAAASSIGGAGNLTLSGALSGAFALTKVGTGTITLSGANTFTGVTTVNGGTLALNYVAANNNKIDSASAITLAGGNLSVTGASATTTQNVASTTLNAGFSNVTVTTGNNQNATLALNAITRAVGGAMNVAYTNTGTGVASVTTNTTNTNGIIGGWATIGGTDWAINSTNANGGKITPYTGYTTDAWAAGTNTNVTVTGTASGLTTNSLRFATAGATTLTLASGASVLTSGGILETSAVGANSTTITGGTTLSGATSLDLIVHQNNTGGSLSIASVIADNTGATGLTKDGAGTLILSGTNTYTGKNYLNGGVLQVSADLNLGAVPVAATVDSLTFNGGTLQFGAAATLAANRGVTLNASNGIFDTNTFNSTVSGIVAGIGGLTKIGAGTLTLAGQDTYTGALTVAAGTLVVQSANSGANSFAGSAININGASTVRFQGSSGTMRRDVNAKTVTFDATGGGALDSGPSINWVFSNNTVVTSGGAQDLLTSTGGNGFNLNAGTLTFNVARGTDPTSDLTVSAGVGNTSALIAKTGAGILTLSGTNTYTGPTNIIAGTLTVSGTGSLGTTGNYAGSITNTGTFNWNSTTAQTLSGQLGGTGPYNFNAGSVTLSGGATGTSTLFVDPSASGTTLSVTGGAYSVASLSLFQNNLNNGTSTYNQSGGTVNVSGTFELGHSTAGNSSGDTNIANITGGTFTAGTLQFYKWANSQMNISGGATVTAGTLFLGWVDSSPTGSITVGNGTTGGTLAWGSATYDPNRSYTLNLKGGTIKATATNASWMPAASYTTASVQDAGGTIDNGGFNVTIGQVLSHGGTNATDGGLAFVGTGITTLSGANAYNGGTTINAGTLKLTNANALGGSTFAGGAGSLVFDSSVATHAFAFGGLSGSSNLTLADNAGTPNAVTLTVGGNNASNAYSGVLSGAGGLIKAGTGTETIQGGNTYAGLTAVNAGTLLVSGSISGSVSVNNGGTLGGIGTVGATTVNSGGTLLPGSLGTLGTLSTNALTFNGGGIFSLQINTSSVNGSNVVASSIDTITGNLTLGTTAPTLAISDLGGGLTLAVGATIPFATYTGSWDGNLFSVGGTNIPNGGTFNAGANTYQLTYNGGATNNTVLLTVVPEPSAYTSLLGGLATLAGLQRFRRRRF